MNNRLANCFDKTFPHTAMIVRGCTCVTVYNLLETKYNNSYENSYPYSGYAMDLRMMGGG